MAQAPVGDGSTGACARCGYAVRGLASWHCPECGADLRESGIRPPRTRGRAPLILLALAVILALAIIFVCSGGWLAFSLGQPPAPPPP